MYGKRRQELVLACAVYFHDTISVFFVPTNKVYEYFIKSIIYPSMLRYSDNLFEHVATY